VIIGPSTVYIAHALDEAVRPDGSDCRLEGWGERLYEFATHPDRVYDFARPGASAASYLEPPEGKDAIERLLYGPNLDHYWAGARAKMQELGGGLLLIQFGGNDARLLREEFPDATHEQIGEAFKEDLRYFVRAARELNFTPVLITSIEKRIRADDGRLEYSRGDLPRWTKELATAEGVAVLDLNARSHAAYDRLSEAEWRERFADCRNRWNGHVQDAHFEPKGARTAASWVRDLACEDADSRLCRALAGEPAAFRLTSEAFLPASRSPALSWANPPKGARSFALVIDDHDAVDAEGRFWVHWVVLNLPADTRDLPAGAAPVGALVERNSSGARAYFEPAFPESHTYVAHVYALDLDDLTRAQYASGEPIYHPDRIYDHRRFEQVFGNFILGEAELRSR